MNIKELRDHFYQQLTPLYPKEELRSFFYLLSEEYLNLQPAEITLQLDAEVTTTQHALFDEALDRLLQEEPIQYVVGKTEFLGLSFKVTPTVLIPRPETEELVEWVIDELRIMNSGLRIMNLGSRIKDSEFSILDIGTGSGCIAVSLAKHLPKATVCALDISKEALHVAEQNAKHNGVDVGFLERDILKTESLLQSFDVIVSNPPYIKENEQQKMQNNVLQHEPVKALFVPDADPLVFYKKIAQLAQEHLSKGGKLFFEINEAHGQETVTLLQDLGYRNVVLKQDVFGKDRMVCGEKE